MIITTIDDIKKIIYASMTKRYYIKIIYKFYYIIM